jgi:hypothetical protein
MEMNFLLECKGTIKSTWKAEKIDKKGKQKGQKKD